MLSSGVPSGRGIVRACSNRHIRGGSRNNNANNCRVANRNRNNPDNRNNNIGFRLARSSDQTRRTEGSGSIRGLNRPPTRSGICNEAGQNPTIPRPCQ